MGFKKYFTARVGRKKTASKKSSKKSSKRMPTAFVVAPAAKTRTAMNLSNDYRKFQQRIEEDISNIRKRSKGRFIKLDPKTEFAMENSGAPMRKSGNSLSNNKVNIDVNNTVTIRRSPVVGDSKLYRTNTTFGDKTLAKGWHYLKAISGVTTGEYRNSIREFDWDEVPRRGSFVHRTGFNQKAILLDKNFYFNRIDVCDLSGFKLRTEIPGASLEWGSGNAGTRDAYFMKQNAEIKAYLGVTKLQDELTIHNTNTYFPALVKIHICCLESADVLLQPLSYFDITDPGALEGNASSNAVVPDTVPQLLAHACFPERMVPGAMAVNNIFTSNDTRSREAVLLKMATRARMSQSLNFRRMFKVIKTYKKQLNPNDVWINKITQHFPKGMNLTLWMAQQMQNARAGNAGQNREIPVGYFPIIEFYGKRCEALRCPINSLTPRALGSSPVELSFEFRNTYEYINDATSYLFNKDSGQIDTPPTLPFVDYDEARVKFPHVKTYLLDRTKDNASALNVPINFDYERLTNDPSYDQEDKYLIPITTDAEVKYASSITGTAQSTAKEIERERRLVEQVQKLNDLI